jgi:hypothetical protein
MPKVATLTNAVIYIYADDHLPPHFHVWGPDTDAQIEIHSLQIMNGKISRRDYAEAVAWAENNQALLETKWSEYNERD